jgi:2-phospho-L-lactate/phosphoenolpyruvate guanylyltransferase
MSESRLWAVVPVKRFDAAKSRLRPVLNANECAELAKQMLQDVLTTLTACPEILSGVIVVASDTAVAETARQSGAYVLLQPVDSGINAAILHAVVSFGADDGVIVVPSDLPQLTRTAIAQAMAAIALPRSMAIAAAAEDGGTNLIAYRQARLLMPRFGPDSFESHLRAAAEIGINARILNLPELAIDIDRPSHLEKFLAMQTNTRTHGFLSRRMIAEATT